MKWWEKIIHPIKWWRYRKLQKRVGNTDPSRFAMPLIRSMYPQQVAQHLVSVQPMTDDQAEAIRSLTEQPEWFAPAGTTRGVIETETKEAVNEKKSRKPTKFFRKLRIPGDSDA